jgi:hypothetical protein
LQIVKVRYFSETEQTLSAREYTYFSEENLAVGDIVVVPVKDTTGKAKVTAIDVPEAEIEHFRAAVKTIPAGAVAIRTITEAKAVVLPEPELADLTPTPYTAAIKIRPETDYQYIEYQKQARDLLEFSQHRMVTTDIDVGGAVNDLGVISMLKKGIEEKRQEYVRPINEHVKAVNAAFKTLTDPIEQADKITREKITLYRAEVDRKRREAEAINQAKEDLARREAALNHGEFTVDLTPVIVPEAPAAHVRAEAATLGTSKVKKWRLIDFKLVPDEYKQLNEVLVGKMVRAGLPGGIPGIEIYEEDSIRITTR